MNMKKLIESIDKLSQTTDKKVLAEGHDTVTGIVGPSNWDMRGWKIRWGKTSRFNGQYLKMYQGTVNKDGIHPDKSASGLPIYVFTPINTGDPEIENKEQGIKIAYFGYRVEVFDPKKNDWVQLFMQSKPADTSKDYNLEEGAGPEKCWPGHRKVGTKPGTGKNAGKRVNDCEKISEQGVAEGLTTPKVTFAQSTPGSWARIDILVNGVKQFVAAKTVGPGFWSIFDLENENIGSGSNKSEIKSAVLDYLSRQGVTEGLADVQQKIQDTINKLEDRLKHAKSDEQWDRIRDRIERLQAALKRSKQGMAEGYFNKDEEDNQLQLDANRRGRLNRERGGSDKIDSMLRQQNEKLAQYNQTGKFWLKQKDTQEHLSDSFTGKEAANQAARDLLKQRPELRGNLLITAYGPGEKQGMSEAGNKPVEKSIFGTGDTRTPRELKSQMRNASDEFVKRNTEKVGPMHSKVAKMQNKLAKSELRKREDHSRIATGMNESKTKSKR